MKWLIGLLSVTAFSYLGWAVGEPAGFGAAAFLSIIGMLVGWYAGRRFSAWLEA